jgi:hypothetical protein
MGPHRRRRALNRSITHNGEVKDTPKKTEPQYEVHAGFDGGCGFTKAVAEGRPDPVIFPSVKADG